MILHLLDNRYKTHVKNPFCNKFVKEKYITENEDIVTCARCLEMAGKLNTVHLSKETEYYIGGTYCFITYARHKTKNPSKATCKECLEKYEEDQEESKIVHVLDPKYVLSKWSLCNKHISSENRKWTKNPAKGTCKACFKAYEDLFCKNCHETLVWKKNQDRTLDKYCNSLRCQIAEKLEEYDTLRIKLKKMIVKWETKEAEERSKIPVPQAPSPTSENHGSI